MDIKFYENKINLNWKPILKSIMEDPDGFIEDGGWSFLDAEQSDEEGAEAGGAHRLLGSASDACALRVQTGVACARMHRWQTPRCRADDEDEDAEYEVSASEADEEESSEEDESDNESLVESDDEDEEEYSGEEDEEEGLSWDELEKQAMK